MAVTHANPPVAPLRGLLAWRGARFARLLLLCLGVLPSAEAAEGIDFSKPWNPAAALPRFITHHFIHPAEVTTIIKYRSGAGHAFSDQYEPNDRSLKNYFQPRLAHLGRRDSLPVYTPTTGTITGVTNEQHRLSNGEHRGVQVSIVPDHYPAFAIRLFHVNLAPHLAVGSRVSAGDQLGYADLREAVDTDWAVAAAWDAIPLYGDSGEVLKAPGYRLVSPFDVMEDVAFATYARYGITERSSFVVALDYRAANPGKFQGRDPNDYVAIQPEEGPTITVPPQSQHVAIGDMIYLTVSATHPAAGGFTYQWKRNGSPLGPVSSNSIFLVPTAGLQDMGFYSVAVIANGVATESPVAIVTVGPTGSSRLLNLSTRGVVPAEGALTPGFVIRGNGGKALLVRGVGPTLREFFGLGQAVADVRLAILPLGQTAAVFHDDDWTPVPEVIDATIATGAFGLVPGGKDAAVLAQLPSSSGSEYTVRITAPGSAAGVALAEVYDPEPLGSPRRLVNVSTLGFAGQGEQALVVGFTIGGAAAKELLIRAVGPGLAAFGVGDRLANPRLRIIPLGNDTAVASNDDWHESGQSDALEAAFEASGAFVLPPGSNDAAIKLKLPPGGYSVQVVTGEESVGTVLVEVYDLDP